MSVEEMRRSLNSNGASKLYITPKRQGSIEKNTEKSEEIMLSDTVKLQISSAKPAAKRG